MCNPEDCGCWKIEGMEDEITKLREDLELLRREFAALKQQQQDDHGVYGVPQVKFSDRAIG